MPSSPTTDGLAERRFLFFGGKGGVGKTTCAAAVALALSEAQPARGNVLAVSLDPAHSLSDVLGVSPREVCVLEVDAKAELAGLLARHGDDLRTIAGHGTYLDDQDLDAFLHLSLPGLDEVMGLLKLAELAQSERSQHIVVDLPPTGHATRLFEVSDTLRQMTRALDLMQDKHRFAVSALAGRYRPDAADAFLDELERDCDAARRALLDASDSAFLLVARPEPLVLAETARYAARLRDMGVPLAGLILNVFEGPESAVALPATLDTLPLTRIPRLAQTPVGTLALLPVGRGLLAGFGTASTAKSGAHPPHQAVSPSKNEPVKQPRGPRQPNQMPVAEAAPGEGQRAPAGFSRFGSLLDHPPRLLIFGGKGGVGKTTVAAAAALRLARVNRRRAVVLLSIDPAHSLADSLGQPVGERAVQVVGQPNLRAQELDAPGAWARFQARWQAQGQDVLGGLLGGGRFDPVYDRQIAAELGKIQPAGLDELQAATEVVDWLDAEPDVSLVLDTAPTGHLLRFLETPGLAIAWTREAMHLLLKYGLAARLRSLSEELLSLSRKAKRLERLLRDGDACELIVVSLAEPAVVAETERLVERLRELGLPLRRIVVNQVVERPSRADGDLQAALIEQLRARFPDLDLVLVERAATPIQGQRDLERLAA